jgi:hypothetical protein
MKGTVDSLKGWFIVLFSYYGYGITGTLGNVVAFGASQVNPLFLVTALIGLALSVSYLYIGITWRKLLVESPKLIDNLLLAGMAYEVITFLLSLSNGFQTGLVIRPASALLVIQLASSLLMLWYVLANVRRLSKEIKSKAQSE